MTSKLRVIHVLPVNDLREHVESETCWCKPAVEQVSSLVDGKARTIVVHNAADARELIERHGVN